MSGANGNNNGSGSGDRGLPLDGLDFDAMALERRTVPVTKGEHTWWLRWDMPAEVMVDRITLVDISDRTKVVQAEIEAAIAEGRETDQELAETLRGRMMAAWDAWRTDVLRICTALFRHSYPDFTADEIAQTFNTNEQRAIIEYFFTLPTRRSSPQPNAGDAASRPTTDATTAEPNRATRRATTTKRRR